MAQQTMKAIVMLEDGSLVVKNDVKIPTPANGEVLIRVENAPINPSDLYVVGNFKSPVKPLPSIPGFEGAGTVVSSGGGWLA